MSTGPNFFKNIIQQRTNTKYDINNLKNNQIFIKYINTIRVYNQMKNKFNKICENNPLLNKIKCQFMDMPNQLKNQSVTCLRTWTRQCEFISAQQVRKGQQMFCLYTKLWEEKALNEFFRSMRQRLIRHSKEFIIGAIGISVYDWKNKGISDDDITKHKYDFDYINMLKNENFNCTCCKKRKPVDISNPNAPHCDCPLDKSSNNYKDNWEPYLERQDLKVWRRQRPNGIYEYKVYGTYSDVTALDFLKVQVDTQYRSKWDATVVQLEVIESDNESNSDIVYWEMLWPRFFTNRDYVFNRRYMIKEEEKLVYLYNKGTEHPSCPETKDKYRIIEYFSCMVIRPTSSGIDQPGIEFSLTYFDNPGLNIPSSVSSWVAMSVMPDFLEKLRVAARGYTEYCQINGLKDIFDRIKGVDYDVKREPDTPLMLSNDINEIDTKSTSVWRYIYPNYYFG